MKKSKIQLLKSGILVSFILGLTIISIHASSSFKDFSMTDEWNFTQKVNFPLSMTSPRPSGTYLVEGTLSLSPFSPRLYKITADDALNNFVINGKTVFLNDIPIELRTNYQRGFTINLSDYLHNGDNHIAFTIDDRGGLMGVQMYGVPKDIRIICLIFLWAILLPLFLFRFKSFLKLPKTYLLFLALAILIRFAYLAVTDYDTRAHDTYEHLQYIEYFVNNWSLPDVGQAEGGAFFHPPLYYFTGAIVYTIVSWCSDHHLPTIYFALQILSLLASVGFVFFGLKTVHLAFEKFKIPGTPLIQKIIPVLAAGLIAFWPSGIIHSVRIGNDDFLYFFFAGALYYLYAWYLKGGRGNFWWAAIFMALAIITKMNGAVLLGVACVILLMRIIFYHSILSKEKIKEGVLALLLVFGALGFAMYPSVKLSLSGERDHLYVDNIDHVSKGLRVGDNLENFIWLDIKTFVTKPFTSPWEDEFGRQYFLNYQGKTGLFGEWRYTSPLCYNTAIAISAIALYMLGVVLLSLWRLKKDDFLQLLPLLLSAFFLAASVTYMRYTFPVNIDFRYILPILIPFCILFNYGLLQLNQKGSTRAVGFGIVMEILFMVLSVLFIIGLY